MNFLQTGDVLLGEAYFNGLLGSLGITDDECAAAGLAYEVTCGLRGGIGLYCFLCACYRLDLAFLDNELHSGLDNGVPLLSQLIVELICTCLFKIVCTVFENEAVLIFVGSPAYVVAAGVLGKLGAAAVGVNCQRCAGDFILACDVGLGEGDLCGSKDLSVAYINGIALYDIVAVLRLVVEFGLCTVGLDDLAVLNLKGELGSSYLELPAVAVGEEAVSAGIGSLNEDINAVLENEVLGAVSRGIPRKENVAVQSVVNFFPVAVEDLQVSTRDLLGACDILLAHGYCGVHRILDNDGVVSKLVAVCIGNGAVFVDRELDIVCGIVVGGSHFLSEDIGPGLDALLYAGEGPGAVDRKVLSYGSTVGPADREYNSVAYLSAVKIGLDNCELDRSVHEDDCSGSIDCREAAAVARY